MAVAVTVSVLALLAIGMWLGGHPGWMPSGLRSAFVHESNGQVLQDIVSLLQKDYYRKVSANQLIEKGIQSAVASLNDPYTHYFDPAEYRAFQNQANPHLSGIGVDVVPVGNGLKVVGVFPHSPAARAGLTAGEIIVRVGATPLGGHSAVYDSSLIRGRAGTAVTITLVSGAQSRTVRLRRADLTIPVASGKMVDFQGVKVGYLQLTSFTEGCAGELGLLVRHLLREGAQAWILDLRGNGGGLLTEAVSVSSIFIPDGTIVTTAGRSQRRQVYLAHGDAIATKQPMAVLVDGGTASAAEIVTAALKDQHRAKVVGTRTYGKGVFQEITPLPNGGALDFTVGEYFTPDGQNLGGGGVNRGAGIQPDVYALDNPHTRVDEALQVAERTVVAELP